MNGHFTVVDRTNLGRRGTLVTRAGDIRTPFFMPDATRASVRGISAGDLGTSGIEALVVNTYHLMLQPGADFMKDVGTVHRFMNWNAPILTPERAIKIQFDLGTDMMVCLDDPRPNDVPLGEMTASVERTIRWAARCREEYDRQVAARGLDDAIHPNVEGGRARPLLFGVVQGGTSVELRRHCAEELAKIGFDGYGFGGRHVDAAGVFLEEIVRETAAAIPEDAPRFALGIGTPEDIVRCHALGWDMFDCVIPTREGRHGRLFVMTDEQRISNFQFPISNQVPISDDQILKADTELFYQAININNEQFTRDFTPVDPDCGCELCRDHTKAYLRHLFRVGDPLGGRLASLHNLRFYERLMEALRK